jgi:hypothetical protein
MEKPGKGHKFNTDSRCPSGATYDGRVGVLQPPPQCAGPFRLKAGRFLARFPMWS